MAEEPDIGRSTGSRERQHATVLFADMEGFTAISERLGEEGTFSLMKSLSELMATAIRENGGTVQEFTGDGLMALFGVPLADEDATLRACRAALAIQARVHSSTAEMEKRHGVRPLFRVGINAGPVVVGTMPGGITAMGDTVNLASRLQGLAQPGSILLSEAAFRGVEGIVEATPMGERQIKGKAETQRLFQLDALREGAARFDRAISRGLTKYVGRRMELAVLDRHLDAIAQGPRAIDLAGDPGIGKSRLLHEFELRVPRQGLVVLIGHCSPDGQQTAYLPIIQMVRNRLEIRPGESDDDIARKLDLGLVALALASAENRGLLMNLLGLRVPERALAGLDGTLIGLKTRDLLLSLLKAICGQAQTVLILEDLHWVDSASEDLIKRLLDAKEVLSLLVIHSRRPEYQPPWAADARTTSLRLAPLSEGETLRIVQTRLGADELPAPIAELVLRKTEGNALFAEELANFLLERGIVRRDGVRIDFDTGRLSQVLPASIKLLLVSRVDHLAAKDRDLLRAASVIGRTFESDLLEAVHPGADIAARLAAMERVELVHHNTKSDRWEFKHALVQDVLYDGLLSDARQELHRQIAAEVERRADNRLEEFAEILAHHYDRSGDDAKAFRYLAMAGKKSFRVYSLDEAERYFQKALSLFEGAPSHADDLALAGLLADYTSLCHVQMRPAKLLVILDRHLERLFALGDLAETVIVLGNLVFAEMTASRWHVMVEHAEYALAMAERLGDDRSKACARSSWILSTCLLGQSTAEQADRQIALALAESERVDDSHLHYLVLWSSAWDCFQRGLTDRGRRYSRELQDRGRRLGDPRALAAALGNLAWFDLVDERYDDMLANASAALECAVAPADVDLAELLKGMALVFTGHVDEGADLLWQVRTRCIAHGWTYITSASDIPLGVTMVLKGDLEKGVRFIEAMIQTNVQLGFVVGRDMARLYLTEVLLELLAPRQRPPLSMVLKNARFLALTAITGWKKAMTMMLAARENHMFSGDSHWRARVEANLGFLYLLKKRYEDSWECLSRARPIAADLNSAALLAKIDSAVALIPPTRRASAGARHPVN